MAQANCLVSIAVMSPHLEFLLCGGKISVCVWAPVSLSSLLSGFVTIRATLQCRSGLATDSELALVLLPGTWSPMAIGEMTKKAFERPLPRLISVTKKKRDERVPDKCHIPYLLSRGLKAKRALCANSSRQDAPVGVAAGGVYRLGLFPVPKVNANRTQTV